jgi:hypothetical protein
MTMKLIDILNENTITRNEMINGLKDLVIPFEYGTVFLDYYDTYNYDSGVYDDNIFLSISVTLDKLESDMFDKAYLAFARKLDSLYDDQYDSGKVKLKIGDRVFYKLNGLYIDLTKYLSVATKNTLRYDKPSVKQILYYGYGVDVNMDLLPHVTDDTYDIIEKKREHGKSVFEFLEDGTLSNGTSYKLIFQDLYVGHEHKENSGRHLDYSDIILQLDVKVDKDFPLNRDEKKEIKKMFGMYGVELEYNIS